MAGADTTRSAIETCIGALSLNPLLGSFGPDDWPPFAKYLEVVRFPAEARVVEEALEGQDMYFIVEGEARISRAHMDLGRIGPGAHFGELALIARSLRAASVIAVTPLVVARLSRARYDAMSSDAPALALRFTQALVGSLGVRLTDMTDSVGLLLRERTLPRRVSVKVRAAGASRLVKMGTLVKVMLPETYDGHPVVAGLVNQKAVSLDTPLTSDASLAPLTTAHWEGKRIYRHSLGLLLLDAAHRVDPSVPVRLGASIGFAQWVHAPVPADRTAELWAARVNAAMQDVVRMDSPFRQELWTVEEARTHFDEQGWTDAALLLRNWRDAAVPLVCSGEMYALSMTPLLPSAGVMSRFPFRLVPAEQGFFLLQYGDETEVRCEADAARPSDDSGGEPNARHDGGKLPAEEPWLDTLGVSSAGDFNAACILGSVTQIIRVSEGLHEKRIGQIADTIARRQGTVRVICVAGPSGSGKTTFIKRLSVQLQVNGIHPTGLSLDDYYLDRDKTLRDASGDYDFEALQALDLGLLETHLRRLLAGEKLALARYDFLSGKSLPTGGATAAVHGSGVLILEGIHGLNPRLLGAILDRAQVFRIFIQPVTTLPFDRLTRVSASDIRLLRRIVRDRHHRGTNAAENIMRWPQVRAGESTHIFPYLHEVDAVFDSALIYEPAVIKVYADRYLLEVPPDDRAFATAHRLRQLLDRFITIYPDHVPPTSILREFIGGSGFEY
jgi:uridine kinase